MNPPISKLLTSMILLTLSSSVLAQTKFEIPTIDIKKQQIKTPIKEIIKTNLTFTPSVTKNSCSETDYIVNTTEEGDAEESCNADRCTIKAAIREAVIDSIRCNDSLERKIILQEDETYLVFETPQPQAFDGPSGPGGYRIGRTAFPSFTQGKYTVVGNGSTIERELRGRGEKALRFFDIATTADVTLENLTLKNGLTSATIGSGYEKYKTDGGAIYNQGQLTVSSVTFDGNNTPLQRLIPGMVTTDIAKGGAIYNRGRGSLIVNNSTFIGNGATTGAAIANYSSGIFSVSGTNFENNFTWTGSIISNYGKSQIDESNFNYNQGKYVIQSFNLMQINDSSFTKNGTYPGNESNTSVSAVIGGWRNVDPDQIQQMIIKRSTFSENIVRNGVVYIDKARVDVEVRSSTIANNFSNGSSINCVARNSKINIGGSTIANNVNRIGNLDIPTGVIISNDCVLQMTNTAITSDIGATCDLSGNGVPGLFSNSFADDMRCRTGGVGNAMLSPLADNGGLTHTMMPRLGSPLIDANPHNLAGSELLAEMMEATHRGNDYWGAMDQRFSPRYTDGAKDIGAVERQATDL